MKTQMPPKAAGHSDIFYTPSWAVKAILEYVPLNYTVWEPACGGGNMVEVMQDDGYNVVGTDILQGFDFLAPLATCEFGYDCIVTNPPYSLKDQWLERCYETGKPFALLLPLTALEGKFRHNLYRKNGLQMLLLPGRVNFITPSGEGSGSWFATAWFTSGLNLPQQLTFSDILPDMPESKERERCPDTVDLFGGDS